MLYEYLPLLPDLSQYKSRIVQAPIGRTTSIMILSILLSLALVSICLTQEPKITLSFLTLFYFKKKAEAHQKNAYDLYFYFIHQEFGTTAGAYIKTT
jgi:hypothetical protein